MISNIFFGFLGGHSYHKSAESQVPELMNNQQQQTAKEQVELPTPIQRTGIS